MLITNKIGITYKTQFYSWASVYKICGLCREDFLFDSEGSNAYFLECLNKWEDK